MTLILTAVCNEFVVQVSDRRFTGVRGTVEGPLTDEGNKQVVVNTPDMRLVVGFTGVASIETAPSEVWRDKHTTDRWIAETIGTVEALSSGLDGCVETVHSAAANYFTSHQIAGPLTVIFAGYTNGSAKVGTVSNCKVPTFRPRDVSDTFTADVWFSKSRDCIAEGCTAALPPGWETRVRAALKRRDYAAVVDVAVGEIRAACRHGKYGKYVGPNCMSVCLFRAGGVQAVYHAVHDAAITFGPNLVDWSHGVLMIAGSPGGRVEGPDGQLIRGASPGNLSVGPSQIPILDRRVLKRIPPRRSH